MADQIDARVKQKTGVEADFAGFVLLEGEMAMVRTSASGPVWNFKVGPGVFESLDWSLQNPGAAQEADTSTVFPTGVPGLYIPTEDGTYEGVTVDLSVGYVQLIWDGSAMTKAEFPIDLSGYPSKTEINIGFPYKRFVSYDTAYMFAKSVVDAVIENPKPDRYYSITNMVIASNSYTIRAHESLGNNGQSSFAVINHTFTDADSGVQLLSGTTGGTEITMLVDVDYMKTLPIGSTTNQWPLHYPLADSIMRGVGKGIITKSEIDGEIEFIKDTLNLVFPYKAYSLRDSAAAVATVVRDMVILNPDPTKFYSLTNLVVAANRGTFLLRAHASDTDLGGGGVAVVNHTFTSQDNGLHTVEGELDGTIIRVLVDVDALKQLPTGTLGNHWPRYYPLADRVMAGSGNGILIPPHQYFPYKAYVDEDLAKIFNRVVKDFTIIRPNPERYYSLTNMVIAPNSYTIRVHDAPTNSGSSGSNLTLQHIFTDADSGIHTVQGTRAGATATLVVDVDAMKALPEGTYGNNWSLNYPLADEVFNNTGNPQYGALALSVPDYIDLQPKDYAFYTHTDDSVPDNFAAVSRVNQPFMQLVSEGGHRRANGIGRYKAKTAGTLNLSALIWQSPDTVVDAAGINSYLTDVQFPDTPNTRAMINRWANFPYREPVAQELIHPEIVDTGATAVGGYRYWLVSSNHPNYSGSWEDEVIFVSNDFHDWKRIRSAAETYDATIHAAGLVLPPQDWVTEAQLTSDMLLPVPQEGAVVSVDGVNKTVRNWLKHDPCMAFDSADGGMYFLLTYHLAFTDDPAGMRAADANQWTVCVRTFNGVNWEVVRQDGSTLALNSAANGRLLFTQTGGKNNYLRHRYRPSPAMLGNSIVNHGGQWWWFYGINGNTIYRGTTVYNVNFDSPQASTSDVFNHPSHFSWDGSIYRWGAEGISVMNATTFQFDLLPIDSMFRGFRGEQYTYKRHIWVNADGAAVWAVADRRDTYRVMSAVADFTPVWHTPLTVGKVTDINQLLAAAQDLKTGYYYSIEVWVEKYDRVLLYRAPFVLFDGTNEYKLTDLLDIEVAAGDMVTIDVTAITYGPVSTAISSIIVK